MVGGGVVGVVDGAVGGGGGVVDGGGAVSDEVGGDDDAVVVSGVDVGATLDALGSLLVTATADAAGALVDVFAHAESPTRPTTATRTGRRAGECHIRMTERGAVCMRPASGSGAPDGTVRRRVARWCRHHDATRRGTLPPCSRAWDDATDDSPPHPPPPATAAHTATDPEVDVRSR